MTAPHTDTPQLEITHEDDPRVLKEAVTEDYSRHVVPQTARSGRWSLAMAWWALFSAMFWLYIAVSTAQAVGSRNAMVGMVLTVLIYGTINGILTRQAINNGLTVALLSRRVFGNVGSVIAPLLFAATAMYYAVFEGSIIALALQKFFAPSSDIRLWYLLVVIYALPLVIGGVQAWLDKLNGVLLPFYVGGLVFIVVAAGHKHGFSNDFLSIPAPFEASVPGWLWAVCIYMGVWIMMMFTVDYARFGKKSDAVFHGTVTFGYLFYAATFLVNGMIGIFVLDTVYPGLAATEAGLVDAILEVSGFVGLLVVIVSQTRINTANYYLASTNLESFGLRFLRLRWPRLAWVVIAGALVYLFMLTDVLSYLLRALAWQGVAVVAWVAIVLTHLAMNRGEKYGPEFRPGRVKAVLPGAWAALVATAVGIGLTELGTAGAWYVLTAPIITFVLAAGLYAVGVQISGDGLVKRRFDPREEVASVWDDRVRCHVCDRSYTAIEMDRDPSAGQQAICAACAEGNGAYLSAVSAESKSLA
jgi:purine-cytosine permease-like protein